MFFEIDIFGGGVWSFYYEYVSMGVNLIVVVSCKVCIYFWIVIDEMVIYELCVNKWRGLVLWVIRILK